MTDYTPGELRVLGEKWMERIEKAEEREGDWIKDAQKAEAMYSCSAREENWVPDYNILHSNVETIVPATYNSTPAPDVRPRHNAQDPDAKEFSDAIERAISTFADDDALNREVEQTTKDIEIAGRGITRVRFDVSDDGVTDPRIMFENVSWRDYREGPAKRWEQVPWVAYRHCVSKEEIDRIEDPEFRDMFASESALPVAETEELDEDIWEVWCRETKTVLFIVANSSRVLSVQPDPLGLKEFFPQPDTITPLRTTGSRLPVCPLAVYKQLAEELDLTTRRINKITRGLKVRGIIISGAEAIEDLSTLADNELRPVGGLDGVMAQGGLDRAISWWPVDTSIAVLRELYAQRDRSLAAIYEITGISDIVRGSSNAAETATAQQIKSQWGSQRIKRKQRMVQSHVRDLFRLTAEIISRQFHITAFAQAAGVPATPQLEQMMGRFDDFRIDVESDSTVRADLTRMRGEMSEFLNASAEYFSTMAPIVQQTPQMAAPAMEIFAAFTRTFQLGKQAEDAIDDMGRLAREQAQQPQQPDPRQQVEAQRQEREMGVKEFDAETKRMKVELDGQKAETEAMFDYARLDDEDERDAAAFFQQ